MDSEWGSLCSLPTKPSKISEEMELEIRNNEKYLNKGDNAKFKAKVSAAVTKAFDAATIGKNEGEFQKICKIIVKYTADGDTSPRESLVAVIKNINIPKLAEFVLNNLEVLKDSYPGVKAYGYLCQMTTEILKKLRTTLSSSDDEATSSGPAFASGKGKKKPSSKSCLDSDDGLGSDSDDVPKKDKKKKKSSSGWTLSSDSDDGQKKDKKKKKPSHSSSWTLGSDSDDDAKKPQKKHKTTHSSGFASGSGMGGSSILSSIGASFDIFGSKPAKEEKPRFSILDDDADCLSFKPAAKSSKKQHLSTPDWDEEDSSALVPQAKTNSTMVSAKQVTSMFRKMKEAVQTQIEETCAEKIEQNNKKLASAFDRSMSKHTATLVGIKDEIFARLPAPATTPAASGGGGAKSTSLKDTVMPGFTKPLGQLKFSDFFTSAQIEKAKAKFPDKEECKRFLLHNYSNYIKGVDAESRRSVFVIWKQLNYPDVGPNPKKGASGSGKAPAPAPTGKTPEEVRADLEARMKALAEHATKEKAGGEAGAAGLEDDAGHGKKVEDEDGKSEDSDLGSASETDDALGKAGTGDALDDPEKKTTA